MLAGRRYLGALIVSAILATAASKADFRTPAPIPGPTVLEQMRSSNFGTIRVVGTVRDRDGTPVNNVSVVLDVPVWPGFLHFGDLPRKKVKANVSGAFEFEYSNAAAVSLRFSKLGFHRLERGYNWSEPHPDCTYSGGDMVCALEAVLRSKRTTTFKVPRGALFEATTTWPKDVWDVAGSSLNPHDTKIKTINNSADLPGTIVYAESLGDGEHFDLVVANPQPGDGFVAVDLQMNAYDPPLALLDEAPGNGYDVRLHLNRSFNRPGGDSNTYFYCRLNGLYGIGEADADVRSIENGTYEVGFTIHIQRDGSRLTDWEW